jgi:hypothetical protein
VRTEIDQSKLFPRRLRFSIVGIQLLNQAAAAIPRSICSGVSQRTIPVLCPLNAREMRIGALP